MTSGIYQIRNLINDKIYVGSSVNIKKRTRQHKNNLFKNKHENQRLQNAWNKYGENSFIFEILEEVKNKEKLLEREQTYLNNLKPEYNICKIAFMPPIKSGEENYNSKLNWDLVKQIRKIYAEEDGLCQEEIAKKFDLVQTTVSQIILNKTWKDKKYIPPKKYKMLGKNRVSPRHILNFGEAKKIRELYKKSEIKQTDLAKKFNVGESTIGAILRNECWKDDAYIYEKKVIFQNGENNNAAKLSWERIKEIRKEYQTAEYSQKELAKKYHVSFGLISQIILNKIWIDTSYCCDISDIKKKINKNTINSNSKFNKLTLQQVKDIRELYNSGNYSLKELAEKYKIVEGTVSKIIKNLTWKDENYHRVYNNTLKAEEHPSNKLNWEIIKEIRGKYKTGKYSQSMLAKEYEVEQTNISFIVRNKTWIDETYVYEKQVPINNLPENNVNSKLSWIFVERIRTEFSKKESTMTVLAKKYNVSVSTISRVILNKSWFKE